MLEGASNLRVAVYVWFGGSGGAGGARMLVCVVVLVLKPRAGRPGGAAGRALNLLSCLLGSKLLFSAARRLERPREAGRLKDDSERGDLQRSDVPIWGWKQAFLPRRSRFTALAWPMLLNPRRLGTSPSFGVCRGCFRPGGDTGGLLEGSQESDASSACARAN